MNEEGSEKEVQRIARRGPGKGYLLRKKGSQTESGGAFSEKGSQTESGDLVATALHDFPKVPSRVRLSGHTPSQFVKYGVAGGSYIFRRNPMLSIALGTGCCVSGPPAHNSPVQGASIKRVVGLLK